MYSHPKLTVNFLIVVILQLASQVSASLSTPQSCHDKCYDNCMKNHKQITQKLLEACVKDCLVTCPSYNIAEATTTAKPRTYKPEEQSDLQHEVTSCNECRCIQACKDDVYKRSDYYAAKDLGDTCMTFSDNGGLTFGHICRCYYTTQKGLLEFDDTGQGRGFFCNNELCRNYCLNYKKIGGSCAYYSYVNNIMQSYRVVTCQCK